MLKIGNRDIVINNGRNISMFFLFVTLKCGPEILMARLGIGQYIT